MRKKVDFLKEIVLKVLFDNGLEYPYELVIDKKIDYKRQATKANIHWKFNPYYQTLNIDDFNEQLYQSIFSLKLMNYPNDLNQYICIRAKVIDKSIEIYTIQKNELLSFDELSSLSKEELNRIFSQYFINANLTNEQLHNFIENS